MNQQTPNSDQPKANFDFIVNQNEPAPKKKSNKKWIILGSLIGAMLLFAIVALLIAPEERVQEVPLSDREISQQERVKEFITLVNEGKNDAAFDMFVKEDPPVSKEEFIAQTVPYLKGLKLSECTYQTADASNATQQTRPVVTCSTIDGNYSLVHEFEITTDDSRSIVTYRLLPGEQEQAE